MSTVTYARWVGVTKALLEDGAAFDAIVTNLEADLARAAELEGIAVDRSTFLASVQPSALPVDELDLDPELFPRGAVVVLGEALIGYRFTPVDEWLAERIGPLPLASLDALLDRFSMRLRAPRRAPRVPLPSWRRRGPGAYRRRQGGSSAARPRAHRATP